MSPRPGVPGEAFPRAALPAELPGIIALIDQTFRSGYPLTMGREFAHMLCERNIDNVRVIVIEGRPVSALGIYRSRVDLEGSALDIASIGAVCTHPDYRGRGFASALMDDALARLAREHVDVLLISGRQKIYLERGCTVVGGFHDCVLETSHGLTGTVPVRDMVDTDLGEAARLFSREPVMFRRTFDEFAVLMENSTFDHYKYRFHNYVVARKGGIAAYLILRLTNGPAPTSGMIIEYAGDRSLIRDALPVIAAGSAVSRLSLHVPDSDPLLDTLRTAGLSISPGTQEGAVRIISFPGLMEKLRVYFSRRLPGSLHGRVSFAEADGRWSIADGQQVFETADMSVLCRLVFDGPERVPGLERVNGDTALGRFLRGVFPIPFPSAKNMNYI